MAILNVLGELWGTTNFHKRGPINAHLTNRVSVYDISENRMILYMYTI